MTKKREPTKLELKRIEASLKNLELKPAGLPAKEPWERTPHEILCINADLDEIASWSPAWADFMRRLIVAARSVHREIVTEAIQRGVTVPENVRKELQKGGA